MSFRRPIASTVLILASIGALVYACGIDITFRAYLEKRLWRPTVRPTANLVKDLPPEKTAYVPYAGMGSSGRDAAFNSLRQAYSALFPATDSGSSLEWSQATINNLLKLLGAVQPRNNADRNELELLRCKIGLRAARPDDAAALASTQSCFESYLRQPRPLRLASEARGWLARTYFLQRKRAAAAKMYLDELANTNSNIRRQRLLTSLEMLYPDSDDRRLEKMKNDLDQYFDTPSHALFIADRVTNCGPGQNPQPDVYMNLLKLLEGHKDLFRQGTASDALALELMRGTIRAGIPAKTLEYAAAVPPDSPARNNPEYNWLSGAANFQLKNYEEAESALIRVVESPSADIRQKRFAENGLVGVYERTQQRVKELHVAFQAAIPVSYGSEPQALLEDLAGSRLDGWSLDVAYLVDLELTDEELETYLMTYPASNFAILDTPYSGPRPAADFVRYALAVRHARREEFAEAAQVYRALNVTNRAKRMADAANLFAATQEAAATPEQRQQALYDYADFLSKNAERVFFNDWVWHQVQTWAFMPDVEGPRIGFFAEFDYRALSPDEAATHRNGERQLRDDQEEYWRAYQIFNQVVEQAGHTELGRKAATRALFCLRRISPERFDRRKEIRSADIRLSNWLK